MANDKICSAGLEFCPNCRGLYRAGRRLKEHITETCSQRSTDKLANRDDYRKTKLALTGSLDDQVCNELRVILAKMRMDEEVKHIMKDSLILYIGNIHVKRQVTSTDRSDHIKARLRYLAKLTLLSTKKTLSEVLMPDQSEKTQEIVNCHFKPNLRIRIGQYMRQAMDSLHNMAIKNNQLELQQAVKDSIQIHESEWKHIVYHKAALQADQQTFNTVKILPLSKDIEKIRLFLDKNVKACIEEYIANIADPYRAKKILATKAIVFNKRRGSEFVSATIAEVKLALTRINEGSGIIQEIDENLTELEKKLVASTHLIRVVGKQGKGVPVLLENDDFKLLNMILADERNLTNTFLFQTSSTLPYRGHDLMAKLTENQSLELELPQALRYKFCYKFYIVIL